MFGENGASSQNVRLSPHLVYVRGVTGVCVCEFFYGRTLLVMAKK